MRAVAFVSVIILLFFCTGEENLLPENFHGYVLKQKLVGNEAARFVNRLHFQDVSTERNEIGFYEQGANSAVIYISHYRSSKQAQDDFEKMTRKISPDNSVFTGGAFLEVDGRRVYRCFGMGQTHFVFAHSRQLFWLSVETTTGKQFLSDYLEYLR